MTSVTSLLQKFKTVEKKLMKYQLMHLSDHMESCLLNGLFPQGYPRGCGKRREIVFKRYLYPRRHTNKAVEGVFRSSFIMDYTYFNGSFSTFPSCLEEGSDRAINKEG